MLNKAKTLKGYKLNSLNGEIGTVKEFYFDETRLHKHYNRKGYWVDKPDDRERSFRKKPESGLSCH